MSRTMRCSRGIGSALGFGLSAMLGPAAVGSTFGVSSSVLEFAPAYDCDGTSSSNPIDAFSGSCEFGDDSGSISGWAGKTLHVELEGAHSSCSCCAHPYSVRGYSNFNVTDLVISATGQTGPVTIQYTAFLTGTWNGDATCTNCAPEFPNPWEIDPPSVPFMQVVTGFGLNTVGVNVGPNGGSSQVVWSGTQSVGGNPTWTAQLFVDIELTHGSQCQSSTGWATATASLGPLNPDGSIGPVFTFPDCPTCTVNAPSIGLVNNYFPAPPPVCPGDVTGNGITDIADFNVLASNFGMSVPPGTNGDLTGDGLVNAADFNVLAGDFGCGG